VKESRIRPWLTLAPRWAVVEKVLRNMPESAWDVPQIDVLGRPIRRVPVADRLWAKVDTTTGPVLVRRLGRCWVWEGSVDGKGYGLLRVGGALEKAHRVAYELVVGPVPEGLQLDHLCRLRRCVRPSHLEPATNRENTLRGAAPNVALHLAGLCSRGHAVEGDNRAPDGTCRRCARERWRRWDARRRAGAA
jgi:hypothetical protein